MHKKSEVFENFKEFRVEVEKQLNSSIKTLRSDREVEYLVYEFKNYLIENRIITAHSTWYTSIKRRSQKKESHFA